SCAAARRSVQETRRLAARKASPAKQKTPRMRAGSRCVQYFAMLVLRVFAAPSRESEKSDYEQSQRSRLRNGDDAARHDEPHVVDRVSERFVLYQREHQPGDPVCIVGLEPKKMDIEKIDG